MRSSLARIPRAEATAILISVVVGTTLLAVKFLAYLLTESAAVFSDAMESIVNVVASGVAFYALAVAHRPADAGHPYGYGKAEFFSAALEGGMILVAAVVILIRALDAMIYHHLPTGELSSGMGLLVIAMLINGGVGFYLVRVGRRRDSLTLVADGKHLLSDAVTSIAALGALVIVQFTGWMWADPAIALAIAAYIAWMGISLMRAGTAGLMDKQDSADEAVLKDILDSHRGPAGREPCICDYHKLRHRHNGRYHWVDFHIFLPADRSIREGHRVASAIEYEIEQAMGEGNATAHVEPCANEDCPCCRQPSGGN